MFNESMKGRTMKIQNMTSSKGNKVANQFIVYADDGVYFQSYKSIIVKIANPTSDGCVLCALGNESKINKSNKSFNR